MEVLKEIIIFILGGFLALSTWSAEHIERGLAQLPSFTTPSGVQEPTSPEIEASGNAPEVEGVSEEVVFEPAVEIPVPERIAGALVSIQCNLTSKNLEESTSGSGIIIDPRGVILTNAHVAQLLLLEDTPEQDLSTTCVVKTGNPAKPLYQARLLYISPLWVHEHADLITNPDPTGTGARDYALLYISAAHEGLLPSEFPYIPLSVTALGNEHRDAAVFVAGYPVQTIEDEATTDYPVVEERMIQGLYGYTSYQVDLISVESIGDGGRGASGGPVVSEDGHVIGIIATRGTVRPDGSQTLRALTSYYINKTMLEETGFSVNDNLTGSLPFRANSFRDVLTPFLSDTLKNELSR